METHQDTSTLKTLADAVTETAEAENTTEGSGSVGTQGLDVNVAFDGGGSAVVTERVVQTETGVVGPAGPDFGSGESKGNGISLGFGLVGEGDKKCGYPNGRENRSGLDVGVGDVNGSLSSEAQMNDNGRNREIEDIVGGREDSDDVEYMEDHGYSVGDLVWGKIKSHPWWPGQIYDPSDASESAMKYNQKGRLLVAYFGDGSFAWCLPSQLIPFAEHFEDMSKQSSSKTFVNAVQEAVDEIGRLVELEMTCPCIPQENRSWLTRPLAVNAGIKAGVLVPDGEIGKILSFRYEPIELLATVGNAAESVSFASMLELAILKGWLSAFYRARGGYVLPVYYRPWQIEGLEDKNGNGALDTNDFSVPIEVPIHRPVEEELFTSAATGSANGQAPQEEKNHYKRKQKSVAELMAEGSGAKHKIRKRNSYGEGTNATNSVTKKQKFIDEVKNHRGIEAASGTKRGRKKKDDISQSGEPTASGALNGCQTEARMQKRALSSNLGKDKIIIPDNNDGEGAKGPEEMSSPRERKKSKYLSPPYTTSHFRAGNLSSKKEDLEREPEKTTNNSRIGERMTKAAGKLLESPSVVRCNCKTVEKRLLEGEPDIGANLSSQTGNQDQKKIIGIVDVNSSVDELLSGVQSFAVNPLYSWNGRLLDLIRGFISAFRRSIYLKESSCKDNEKRSLARKRKSLKSEPEKLVNDLNQTGGKSLGARTDAKKSKQEKSEADTPKAKTSCKNRIQEKSNAPKSKKAARHSGKKGDNEEADKKSSPASLIVTFAPGFSLPSRDDIIGLCRKFGDLNEQETGILPNSCSVQIWFTRSSDAEEALRQKPFGFSSVDYELSYSSATSVAVEPRCQISDTVVETPRGPLIASNSAVGEITDLGSMREKLKIMTSMLEKCDGKISSEARSKLNGDIKLLFEKVKKIAETDG